MGHVNQEVTFTLSYQTLIKNVQHYYMSLSVHRS